MKKNGKNGNGTEISQNTIIKHGLMSDKDADRLRTCVVCRAQKRNYVDITQEVLNHIRSRHTVEECQELGILPKPEPVGELPQKFEAEVKLPKEPKETKQEETLMKDKNKEEKVCPYCGKKYVGGRETCSHECSKLCWYYTKGLGKKRVVPGSSPLKDRIGPKKRREIQKPLGKKPAKVKVSTPETTKPPKQLLEAPTPGDYQFYKKLVEQLNIIDVAGISEEQKVILFKHELQDTGFK